MFPEQMPRVFAASEVEAEMTAVIARIQSLHDSLVATITPSTACFANVFAPWIEMSNEVDAKTESKYQKRRVKCEQIICIRRGGLVSPDLFDLIKAAASRNEDMDPESEHWVEENLRDFATSGHESLQGPDLEMFLSQRSKIEELKVAFERNLREEGGGVVMTREELSGVSEEHLQKWKQNDDDGAESFFVPFGNGAWSTVMRYVHLESSRRRMFLAEEMRMHANVPLFRNIVRLRDSQARLLGYRSHGDFRLQGRAIKPAAYTESLLSKLGETLIPKEQQEFRYY
ncbi:hypothetical protein NHJ13051_005774 [Beauveria bassiana]